MWRVLMAACLSLSVTTLGVGAETSLTGPLNYRHTEEAIPLSVASVEGCVLRTGTLERAGQVLVSREASVDLADARVGGVPWVSAPPDGGPFTAYITLEGDVVHETLRVDWPTRWWRRHFRNRFDQRCERAVCMVTHQTDTLTLRVLGRDDPRATLSELARAFEEAVAVCSER